MITGRKYIIGWWSVVVVSLVVAIAPGRARAADTGTPAEITAAVSVRRLPRADAAVVQDLAAGTSVSVRARYGHWVRIGGAVRGWIPVEAIGDGDIEAQARASRSQASGDGRDESDLMMDAITAERGESPNASRIVRVADDANAQSRRQAADYADARRRADAMVAEARLAASREAIRRARLRARTARYWKDPFEDGPPRLVPSREASTMDLTSARREVIRARAEAIAAVVDAEAARAEAARARADAARARADAREVIASSDPEDSESASRAGCRDGRARRHIRMEEAQYTPDDATSPGEEPREQRDPPREHHHTRHRTMKTAMAQPPVAARQPAPNAPAPPSPNAWRSTGGIIIEPINKAPSGR